MRPLALDLFCGAGGASMGLHRAGFDVVGVDINLQRGKRYSFQFIQGDALRPPVDLRAFNFIWASPPCQAYTAARTRSAPKFRKVHPDLVADTRALIASSGVLFCIENVVGAPLRTTGLLCGEAFDLGATGVDGKYRPLKRHRLVETNFPTMLHGCRCSSRQKIGVYGTGGGASDHGYKGSVAEWRTAMGMPEASMAILAQAVPPAYAEFIGRAALEQII